MEVTDVDVVIVGAGIVGLATAERLVRERPAESVVVLEKEERLAAHQTGRNSGVIHSGIYYAPGSQKATLCRRGRAQLIELCHEEGVAHEICGKVIVAVDDAERPRLAALSERAAANGVMARALSSEELAGREPQVTGVAALLVPDAGIVDYRAVCEVLARRVIDGGGAVLSGRRVTSIARHGSVTDITAQRFGGALETFRARRVVNCAGLHSDRVMQLSGRSRPARIVPFRGEYFELTPGARGLCRHLVYPVPDPAFPFLGVHFTRMIGGGVECGPNAVLALAREGYTWRDVDLRDVADVLGYRGFWRLVRRHARAGLAEVHRSLSKRAFVRALQRLIPAIAADDLVVAPAGVRAQALAPSGALIDDFLLDDDGAVLHVVNAPSPAATASLAIAETIAERLMVR